MNIFLTIKTYLIESISEMKKVVWPSRKQAINYTILVIIMSIGVAVFFSLLDYIFNLGLEVII